MSSSNFLGGVGRDEYIITVDMAKELSMVERNANGREARLYFIACEKEALRLQSAAQSQIEGTPTELLTESANFAKLLRDGRSIATCSGLKGWEQAATAHVYATEAIKGKLLTVTEAHQEATDFIRGHSQAFRRMHKETPAWTRDIRTGIRCYPEEELPCRIH